ncbi:MAG: DegT/DnrJ/EryC1/StrS aminotransferase family protein [Ignavibacteriaceae bacterium]|nr:DegT/DnrJ/EryC1/StrS aminotransferase family protein [Ignavibacteriaceae bacterium]
MRKSYLIFGSPKIEEEDIEGVVQTLRSGWIGTGPKVNEFEKEFAEYVGAKYAAAVSSCTAGLHLCVLALGIDKDSEVIVPTMTFAATANAVIHAGARPVFVDVDPLTMLIDPDDIRRKITKRTKAIIPVHFAGRPCNIDEINKIADEHNLYIIHDNAHAIESEYKGMRLGTSRDIAAYSFYVTKNLTTAEGGMVTTNNQEIAAKIKMYALHGLTKDAWKRFSDDGYKHYQIVYPGFKYNMTDIQASLGLSQFRKIEKFYSRRAELWQYYKNELKDLPLLLPPDPEPDTRHGFHLFILLLDINKTSLTRDQVINKLHNMKIGTGVHYIALHLHPYYQQAYGYGSGDFPNAEFISERTFSIPFSANLTDEDAKDVVGALKLILR